MNTDLATSDLYRQLITDLKGRIQSAQAKATLAVNTQLIELYWDIGKTIVAKQQESGWGDAIIAKIADDLTRELGGLKGFTPRYLRYMKQFYSFYLCHGEFVKQAVSQIPWSHNILILQKIKDQEKALWYVNNAIENGWSRNVLGIQIENQLYERQVQKPKIDNFATHLPSPQSELVSEVLKDPYIFDFISAGADAKEREIETALVDKITHFMLELGKGFAFVGRQYHLEVGGEDFYLDLLFYHLRLRCYVVIELKAGQFKPEYAGKLNFYLTALDELVKMPQDNPSIGLILCKDRNNVIAEYSLRDIGKPIGISRYQLSEKLPDDLKANLPTAEEVERMLEESPTK
jgi:predicted nuclease of restriction endonuclease-like (RecB) superfamily